MPRARKRHVQLELPTLDKNGQRRGGKRAGAGRPKKGFRASEKHKVRALHRATDPVHVIMRACGDVGSLRRHAVFLAIREATLVVAATEARFPNFRIVHLSIQRTHIHLIVEAANRKQLWRGMQAFSISAARQINASTGRLHGRVFADRYHARALGSPGQVRNCIAYVLRGSIKRRVDVRSGSGDHELCLSSPRTALGRLSAGLAEILSRGSRSIVGVNSTA